MDSTRFAGRVAVVTGGNRGIGLEIARQLAEGGARVAIWARDTDRMDAAAAELSTLTEVQCVRADVASEADVRAAADATLGLFGKVDILVNNAGILGPSAPVGSYSTADFAQVMQVNLMGTFHCCSALVPAMKAAGYGRIVTLSSASGKDGNPFVSGYSCSKAAQIAFTKALAKEVATDGILVNAVTPSASPTDIFGDLDEALTRALLSRVPMGRFVQPHEIAKMVCWLCSDDCSFSTGATFDITGGRTTF
ncbi:hypothetical protein ATO6_20770 [Oceanicola sp. 22II-s10i]|nr:hypothetical protein ATO6_20770 [Oceanicola sp. 22II-s10i]